MQCHVQQLYTDAIVMQKYCTKIQFCKCGEGPGFTAPCSQSIQVSMQARVNNCQTSFTSCGKWRIRFKVHSPFRTRKVCFHMTGRLHINTLAAVVQSELHRHFTTPANTPCGFGRYSVNSAVFTLPMIECESTVEEGSTMSSCCNNAVVVVVANETSSFPNYDPGNRVELPFRCHSAHCT